MLDLLGPQGPEIEALRHRAGLFALQDIVPDLEKWERAGTLPRSLFQRFGAEGFVGLMVPREFSGAGLDVRHALALAEGLMERMAFAPMISLMMATNSIAPLLARHASADLRNEFLPDLLAGNIVGALAVTERESASDLKNTLQASARSDGDDWILSGEKLFITNGPIADVVLTLCRTGGDRCLASMSLIAVPRETPGFSVERLDKIGLHASPVGRLRFDGCRVAKRYTLGRTGSGFLMVGEAQMRECLVIAAGAAAFALACLSRAMRTVARSAEGDLPLHVALMVASRALCYEVAESYSRGEFISADTTLVKFAVCEAARRAVQSCQDCAPDPAERRWFERASCDARALTIFVGASEAMREAYGQRIGGQARQRREP
jgi:alkylation response protein AidB-like acyl-CoA dehydrogenase